MTHLLDAVDDLLAVAHLLLGQLTRLLQPNAARTCHTAHCQPQVGPAIITKVLQPATYLLSSASLSRDSSRRVAASCVPWHVVVEEAGRTCPSTDDPAASCDGPLTPLPEALITARADSSSCRRPEAYESRVRGADLCLCSSYDL